MGGGAGVIPVTSMILFGKSCQILYRVVARGGSKDHLYVGWQMLEEDLLQKHRCVFRGLVAKQL